MVAERGRERPSTAALLPGSLAARPKVIGVGFDNVFGAGHWVILPPPLPEIVPREAARRKRLDAVAISFHFDLALNGMYPAPNATTVLPPSVHATGVVADHAIMGAPVKETPASNRRCPRSR